MSRSRRLAIPVLAFVGLASPGCLTSQTPAAPRTGAEVLERMRAAYAGKWYHTLTFRQQTTRRRPNGTDTVETWYESLRHTGPSGVQLRIDFGNPSAGNGTLYTADSSWRMRGGTLASASADGNAFLPLIEGVYVQPVAQTVKDLASTHVDMGKVTRGTWQARDVWIVGAASTADSVSPQFWVDTGRHVVVRALLSFGPNAPPLDIHLDGYVPLGGGMLATKIVMSRNGTPIQTEQYADWKADVPLDAALFAPATWTSARHWLQAK